MKYANVLVDDYYIWLLDLIDNDKYDVNDYTDVLDKLFRTEFYDLVDNDSNRIEDGFDLRNDFSEEIGEHLYFVMDELPDFCSVLEMMIALARRMETDICYDENYGDRSAQWFWMMMENLGLIYQDNDHYDEDEVSEILDNFLERHYSKTGQGGLFSVKNGQIDMREIEIWYQMNYFLDEFL